MSADHETIAQWLKAAHGAVAFTGAGVSTESGIPDFRSPGGVWSRTQPVYFDDFLSSADARLEYWRQKTESHRDMVAAQPNAAHVTLARWESANQLSGVITQNIDGLHQLAGSHNVLELHGTARQIMCLGCEQRYDADPMVDQFTRTQEVPHCPECGGMLKHATISFGQALSPTVLEQSMQWSRAADFYLVLGSSLVVEPAATLPRLAKDNGARLIIINRDSTPLDTIADAVLHASIGQTMTKIDQARQG